MYYLLIIPHKSIIVNHGYTNNRGEKTSLVAGFVMGFCLFCFFCLFRLFFSDSFVLNLEHSFTLVARIQIPHCLLVGISTDPFLQIYFLDIRDRRVVAHPVYLGAFFDETFFGVTARQLVTMIIFGDSFELAVFLLYVFISCLQVYLEYTITGSAGSDCPAAFRPRFRGSSHS